MKQAKNSIADRLKHKKEQYANQQKRMEQLEQTMHNTKEDIEQMEYAMEEIERARKGKLKRRIVRNQNISDFFARFSALYDNLQHRYHVHFNYKVACMIIYHRYRFQSRSRTPGKRYLSEATVLTYFKYERNEIGVTIPH